MQQTIRNSIEFRGIGVHKGEEAVMTLYPAPVDHGITFARNDFDTPVVIDASYENVIASELCTLLCTETKSGETVTISTVEHILSALRGLNVDNVRIELSGPEIPIMDGSSIEFVKAIQETGVEVQDAVRQYIRVLKPVRVEGEGGKFATLQPSKTAHFTFEIDFEAEAIGHQIHEVSLVNGHYVESVAAARTFGLYEQVQMLREKGLALGGSLENAIVVDRDRVLNPEGLRFENEFARHKNLDAIGDLYLAGAPIIGAFYGYKAGHALHTQLLKALFADAQNYEWVSESNPAYGLGAQPVKQKVVA